MIDEPRRFASVILNAVNRATAHEQTSTEGF
jgi:hypothetical protein